MSENTNDQFELRGLNRVAMECKDISRTVDFYTNVLGSMTELETN